MSITQTTRANGQEVHSLPVKSKGKGQSDSVSRDYTPYRNQQTTRSEKLEQNIVMYIQVPEHCHVYTGRMIKTLSQSESLAVMIGVSSTSGVSLSKDFFLLPNNHWGLCSWEY